MATRLLWLCLLLTTPVLARQPFYDRSHFSQVFGQERFYRIFLPAGYEEGREFYPVVYYFHGHSDRYTLEHYDQGRETVPAIARFVATHPLIVVAVDGYVAEDYPGFYGGSPWDIREEGGRYDFGRYFLELVGHVDGSYRTLTDRRHRGTSGLSMGGFMSLYLSARFPHLIGSASAFNPGPEFYVGDKGRRVLWRPKDHVRNHEHTRVRLVRASGDYISQYHEETRQAYARAPGVRFEFGQDEYHRHAATSIEETLAFHLKAFEDSSLDNVPVRWSHADPHSRFQVWGYEVEAPGEDKALVYLENVTQGGLRIRTRRWAPDGPPLASRSIHIRTPPYYQAGAEYRLLDYHLASGRLLTRTLSADPSGRLEFQVDGSGHQVSFWGPGTGGQPPVLLPLTDQDTLYLPPGQEISFPIRVYNPRSEPLLQVEYSLSSDYPIVELLAGRGSVPRIEAGGVVDLSRNCRLRLTSGGGYFWPASLQLRLTYDGWHTVSEKLDIQVIPEVLPEPAAVEILDGRTVTFSVFRQAGNQGGGRSVSRTVTEGKGNGNGVLEPGEEATLWVQMLQGMDPFDKKNWYRCKIRSDSPYLEVVADLQEEKQREWTGARERTSQVRLREDAPSGIRIPLLLENETWSFHYTPDVRYGEQPLYQAFQLHTRHLHRYLLQVP